MGIFRKNDNDEEFLTILSEIRDNLKTNNDNVITELESKLADVKYSNDEELGVWANRVIELEKTVAQQTKQLDENYTLICDLQKQKDQMIEVLNKYTNIIKDFTEVKEIETETPKKDNDFIRKYSESIRKQAPNPQKIKPNGKFILKSGKTSSWNITILFQLKKLIPSPISMTDIAKKTNIGITTANYLCYSIEAGIFDKFFNEWEQMQMKKTYGNWKPSIENNPEKRKEKGYC